MTREQRRCFFRTAIGVAAAVSVASAAAREPEAAARADPVEMPGQVDVALRVPKGERVAFRGVVAGESASGPDAQLLYPAPNAAGFLASVFTHALIVGSAQESRKSRQQEAADAVLGPYRSVLDAFTHAELMQRAVARMQVAGAKRLLAPSESHAQGWLIESAPVFSMTQDQAALIIDNAIAVFVKGGGEGPARQYVIRVVSDPLESQDPAAHWSVSDAEALKESSARLVAISLDVAISAAKAQAATGTGVHKTVRYYEGRVEKMERGELLAEGCGRRLIKTLRGWLMSVPTAREGGNGVGECRDAAGAPK